MTANRLHVIYRNCFTFASALSFLVLAAALVLCDLSYSSQRSIEFQHQHARWEVAGGDGLAWIGNAPQIRLETANEQPRLREMQRSYAHMHGALQATIEGMPKPSKQYEQGIRILRRTEESYEQERKQLLSGATTKPVVHEVRLSLIARIAAILPAAWMCLAVARHRGLLRELRRPSCALSALLLLISLPLAVIALRSYWITATWDFPTQVQLPLKSGGRSQYLNRHMTIARGRVQFYGRTESSPAGMWIDDSSGYHRGGDLMPTQQRLGGVIPPGDWRWWVPGISYATRPDWHTHAVIMLGYNSTVIALWLPLLICWIPPAMLLRARWRANQRQRCIDDKLCHACGYSLVGNASGVCPECGIASVRAWMRSS